MAALKREAKAEAGRTKAKRARIDFTDTIEILTCYGPHLSTLEQTLEQTFHVPRSLILGRSHALARKVARLTNKDRHRLIVTNTRASTFSNYLQLLFHGEMVLQDQSDEFCVFSEDQWRSLYNLTRQLEDRESTDLLACQPFGLVRTVDVYHIFLRERDVVSANLQMDMVFEDLPNRGVAMDELREIYGRSIGEVPDLDTLLGQLLLDHVTRHWDEPRMAKEIEALPGHEIGLLRMITIAYARMRGRGMADLVKGDYHIAVDA